MTNLGDVDAGHPVLADVGLVVAGFPESVLAVGRDGADVLGELGIAAEELMNVGKYFPYGAQHHALTLKVWKRCSLVG